MRPVIVGAGYATDGQRSLALGPGSTVSSLVYARWLGAVAAGVKIGVRGRRTRAAPAERAGRAPHGPRRADGDVGVGRHVSASRWSGAAAAKRPPGVDMSDEGGVIC